MLRDGISFISPSLLFPKLPCWCLDVSKFVPSFTPMKGELKGICLLTKWDSQWNSVSQSMIHDQLHQKIPYKNVDFTVTVSTRFKHIPTPWPVNPTPKYMQENGTCMSNKSLDKTIWAALFKGAPNWEQPRCPSTGEWRNKLWFIHLQW